MPGHDQQGIPEPIWLVGRGPVGERWVTVEGLEMVSRAQVLVHEAPAEPWLAGRAHPGTLHLEGVLVEMIDRILEETVQGRCVVCLCTGDPLLDQGGLALAQALQAAGRAYRIIPGITEIQKQAVAVGLPLAEALKSGGLLLEPARVVSSEHPSRGGRSTILWGEAPALGAACGRILKENRVDAAGLLVAGAGRSEQVVLDGPVASLQERISRWEGSSALMLVTGPVTRSEARLDWLTRRPLHGRTIVITRPDEEGTGLGARLSQAGAQVINCPTIGIEPLSDTDYLDRALLSLKEYQWVILTSANGARIFFRRLKQLNLDARALASARVAAIGPATAAVILASGIRPDCIPEEYRAEGLVKALADLNLAGARVLLPRASVARDLLPAALKQQGAVVDVVPTYRTIRPTAHAGEVVRALKAGDVDAVTFTSSSTVRNFVGLFRAGEAARLCREGGAIAACIGPVTAATARSEGLAVGVEAATSTLAGLVAALSSQFLPPAHAS